MKTLMTILITVVVLAVGSIRGEPVTAISQMCCVSAPSGLVSWWPGDGNANDVQDGNNGTLVGATFAPGKVGQAFSFDGVDDFVRIPNNASLNPGTADFTVDFWMRTISTGVFPIRTIMGKRSTCAHGSFWDIILTSPGCCFIPAVQDGRLLTELDQDAAGTNYNQIVSTIAVNDGNWHHIALVRQGTTATLYIDNMVRGSASTSGVTNIANTADLLFGNDPCVGGGRQVYEGGLDEIEYFNRALSPGEIAAIFNAGSAGKCPLPQIQAIVGKVQALVDAGVLNHGQGKELTNKLDEAIKNLDKGHEKEACKEACNALEEFIKKVDKFIKKGTLTPAQGQPLIDAANNVRNRLGCNDNNGNNDDKDNG